MKFSVKLQNILRKNNSFVCVGLDPDLNKLPDHLRNSENPIFEFNRSIVDATHDCVCAYKPQIAYYSAFGAESQLEMTIAYIREKYPEIVVILDAKRGDIGSTAQMYAKEAFDRYAADAVTVNPYMGSDTLDPYLCRADKGVVVLCKTSNPGSGDLQDLLVEGGALYLRVAKLAADKWNTRSNVMLVVGATFPEEMAQIRMFAPDIPFLVPGIGAQGGDVEAVLRAGCTPDGLGLVINSSRGIIYADDTENFAEAARAKTIELRDQINSLR
jgi:orotidine-5'-phosphate decarboxylase